VSQILLQCSYKGTRYGGFQVQPNAPTVQQALQDALEALFGARPPVTGCSRTDAGVHAQNYYCTTLLDRDFALDRLPQAINAHLPDDIAVRRAAAVAPDFHPRYMALGKRYVYRIWLHSARNVFWADTSHHVRGRLDPALFAALAGCFVGRRDFSSLQAAGSEVADTVRTIHRCEATLEDDMLTLSITGDGFLYKMVRILAGTLIEAASKGRGAGDIEALLAACNRRAAGPTAPARGLTLMQVYYPPGSTGIAEAEVDP